MAEDFRPIHQLELHESSIIATSKQTFVVTRVPGGWIYGSKVKEVYSTVFVPYNSDGDTREEVSFKGEPTAH